MTTRRTFGSYTLTDYIGRGGMGEVWRGRHGQLDRDAAIKLIHPERQFGAEARTMVRRFEREARATSALRSPHTVEVYDFGTSEDGTFYYAMELLDGLDFGSLIERFGPQPPARAIGLLSQVCDSLGEAHARGLVHRDIKPTNLFACRMGLQADFVKVLDFGLVKVSDPGGDESRLTRGDVAPGSPAFMPPESIDGSEAVDARSDIYGVGCVAYWLLTGKLVFEGETALKILVAHAGRMPESPAKRSGRPIPQELDDLVMRCLAKSPDERPSSCKELARLLAAVPVEEPWTREVVDAWWAAQLPGSRWDGHVSATDARPDVLAPEQVTEPAVADVLDALADTGLVDAREAVQAALRREFVHSRLGFSEMDRRVEAARNAEAVKELRPLLADLPDAQVALPTAAPEPSPEPSPEPEPEPEVLEPSVIEAPVVFPEPPKAGPLVRLPTHPAPPRGRALQPRTKPQYLVSVLGGVNRRGTWQPPRKVRVVSVLGSSELDFRKAEMLAGPTELTVLSVLGSIELTVPPGLYVEVDGVGVLGSFENEGGTARPPEGDEPWLRVRGAAVLGSVEVEVEEMDAKRGFFGRRKRKKRRRLRD